MDKNNHRTINTDTQPAHISTKPYTLLSVAHESVNIRGHIFPFKYEPLPYYINKTKKGNKQIRR